MNKIWVELKSRIQQNGSKDHRFYPAREILFGAGIITILLSLLMWWTEPAPRYSTYFISGFAVIVLIGFHLLRYRFIEYLNYFIPTSYWLLLSLFVIFQGGFETAALGGFALIIIYAGLAINSRTGFVFAGLSMVFALLIYFFETVGVLGHTFIAIEENWLIYEALYLGAALVVYVDGNNLKMARKQISESEARYQALFDRSNDGVFILGFNEEILTVNRQGSKLLGYEEGELVGLTAAELIPPDERGDADHRLSALFTGNVIPIYERILLHKSGTLIPFEISLTLVNDKDGNPAFIQSVIRDISDRKRAEQSQEELFEQVQESKKRLQLLSRQLVEVQESERRFIATELHDEIGQTLTGLQFLIEAVSKERIGNAAGERLHRAKALVNELMQRVRQLSLDLRPAMLDDFGLIPALDWIFERYAAQTDVEVIFDHANVEGRRFGVEVETAMYRLIQEALNNVARHAGVNYVYVYIKEKEGLLIATVKDTGRGADPETLTLRINQTAGITGMRERVALLDGSIQIHTKEDQGMTVVASIPIMVSERE